MIKIMMHRVGVEPTRTYVHTILSRQKQKCFHIFLDYTLSNHRNLVRISHAHYRLVSEPPS